jgi:hypothetical protein
MTLAIFGDDSVRYYSTEWKSLPGIAAQTDRWQSYQLDVDIARVIFSPRLFRMRADVHRLTGGTFVIVNVQCAE